MEFSFHILIIYVLKEEMVIFLP